MSKFRVGDRVKSLDLEYKTTRFFPYGVVESLSPYGYRVSMTQDDGSPIDLFHRPEKLMLDDRFTDTSATQYPAYFKDVSTLDTIDVYAVHKLFGIDDPSGAIQHASKKLLLSGVRTGGKSKVDDVREARDALTRWLEMEEGK